MPASVNVTWAAQSGATAYHVEYKKQGEPFWTEPGGSPTTATSLNITGLDEGSSYDIRVITVCDAYQANATLSSGVTPCKNAFNLTADPSSNSVLLTWNQQPEHLSYTVQYKKSTDAVYTTAPGSPQINDYPSPNTFLISGLENGTLYNFAVTTNCSVGNSSPLTINSTTIMPIWIEATSTCEQTIPFSLVSTYTGFASPGWVWWNEASQRYYVVDIDDPNGNTYYFNPDSITGYATRTVIPGTVDAIQAADYDPVQQRVWCVGHNTNGARVIQAGTNAVSTVTFGTNGAYFRTLCKILGDTVYCSNRAVTSGPTDIVLINKDTMTVTSTIANSAIPSGNIYFSGVYNIYRIGNEIWCCAASRPNGQIAIYNNTLTSLITTITLAGATTWSSGAFWQGQYYDAENNRFYVHDSGSNRFYCIDPTTRTPVPGSGGIVQNRGGKTNSNMGFVQNPITGDLYMTGSMMNSSLDNAQISKAYKINRSTGTIEYMYPNQRFSTLSLRTGTTEMWTSNPGAIQPQGGSWQTDGQILKYTT